MKFDPPLLTEGPLSRKVYVVTHGKREPHPTIPGEEMITASVKYDVTEQFEALAAKRRLASDVSAFRDRLHHGSPEEVVELANRALDKADARPRRDGGAE